MSLDTASVTVTKDQEETTGVLAKFSKKFSDPAEGGRLGEKRLSEFRLSTGTIGTGDGILLDATGVIAAVETVIRRASPKPIFHVKTPKEERRKTIASPSLATAVADLVMDVTVGVKDALDPRKNGVIRVLLSETSGAVQDLSNFAQAPAVFHAIYRLLAEFDITQLLTAEFDIVVEEVEAEFRLSVPVTAEYDTDVELEGMIQR